MTLLNTSTHIFREDDRPKTADDIVTNKEFDS